MEDSVKLGSISQHPDVYIRAAVASNKRTPNNILKVLARDPSIGIRASVAGNRATSQDTLSYLGKVTDVQDNKNWPIFLCLAGNQNTPKRILKSIYTVRKNWAECLALVNNCSTPKSVIKALSKEADPNWREIRIIALKRIAS